MSVLKGRFSRIAAALAVSAASFAPALPGNASRAFAEEAAKTKQTESTEAKKEAPVLASAARIPSNENETAKAGEKKDLGYDVVVLPPPKDENASSMGPLAESMKNSHQNQIVIFAYARAGTKQAELQNKILDTVLPKVAKDSKRRITVIKASLGFIDKEGNVNLGYEPAMIGAIDSMGDRFNYDGVNLMTRGGYPDTYLETYINIIDGEGRPKGYRVSGTSIKVLETASSDEQKAEDIERILGKVIAASNRQFEKAKLAAASASLSQKPPAPSAE